MEYKERQYPAFSACGLNCGLCPRYHTAGTSRCPGCAGKGFLEKHPTCGILSCCQRHGIEYCYLCEEYPCKKYDGADLTDSFITHKNQLENFDKVRSIGLEAYIAELNNKMELLEQLLNNFDDGRKKSLFCTAVNLLKLEDIKFVIERIHAETNADTPIREKSAIASRLIQAVAEQRDVSLQLRKKTK